MTRTFASIAVSLWAAIALPAQTDTGREPADEQAAAPTGLAAHPVVTHLGLRYGPEEPKHPRQTLDLFLPTLERDAPRPPLLVFFHGGSWRAGSRAAYRPIGTPLAAPGFAVAIPGYRLTPEVQHPLHAEDCALAVAWLRTQAEKYGYDGDRIVLAGHSAGAHLAALLATAPKFLAAHKIERDAIRGVIGLSGPFDVRAPIAIFENAFGEDLELRDEASPLRQDLAGAPPFLLLWADRDLLGLEMVNRSMVRELARADVPHTGREIPGRNHISIASEIGEPEDPVAGLIAEFVAKVTAVKR